MREKCRWSINTAMIVFQHGISGLSACSAVNGIIVIYSSRGLLVFTGYKYSWPLTNSVVPRGRPKRLPRLLCDHSASASCIDWKMELLLHDALCTTITCVEKGVVPALPPLSSFFGIRLWRKFETVSPSRKVSFQDRVLGSCWISSQKFDEAAL